MKILLLGSGGREHALAWKLVQSARCELLYIAPGNAGTAECGTNVAMGVNDFEAIAQFCVGHKIDMVVVGPEDPLVNGIYDYFAGDESLKNIPVIGPSREGAQLEGSKDFAKAFMHRHGIPTAGYKTFTKEQLQEGLEYIDELKFKDQSPSIEKAFKEGLSGDVRKAESKNKKSLTNHDNQQSSIENLQSSNSNPIVLKADGLAAGKGVVIVDSIEAAKKELEEMLAQAKFGDASAKVVIEEFLAGIEVSVFVLTDGKSYLILPEAKDYKRIGDGDTGLNTGGMGAVSPVPFVDAEFMRKVEERIIKPTVEGLRKEKIEYRGFIFIGLMNVGGEPFVIEYNCRMGDPETEVVIPRVKNDLAGLFEAVAEGRVAGQKLEVDERTAVTVMLVSGGYPGVYDKGKEISGLSSVDGSIVFHAGTGMKDGKVVTAGGRVLAVTSFGNNLSEARDLSYQNVGKIVFDGIYCRNDIGNDLLKHH